jgi:hypothetical protein
MSVQTNNKSNLIPTINYVPTVLDTFSIYSNSAYTEISNNLTECVGSEDFSDEEKEKLFEILNTMDEVNTKILEFKILKNKKVRQTLKLNIKQPQKVDAQEVNTPKNDIQKVDSQEVDTSKNNTLSLVVPSNDTQSHSSTPITDYNMTEIDSKNYVKILSVSQNNNNNNCAVSTDKLKEMNKQSRIDIENRNKQELEEYKYEMVLFCFSMLIYFNKENQEANRKYDTNYQLVSKTKKIMILYCIKNRTLIVNPSDYENDKYNAATLIFLKEMREKITKLGGNIVNIMCEIFSPTNEYVNEFKKKYFKDYIYENEINNIFLHEGINFQQLSKLNIHAKNPEKNILDLFLGYVNLKGYRGTYNDDRTKNTIIVNYYQKINQCV